MNYLDILEIKGNIKEIYPSCRLYFINFMYQSVQFAKVYGIHLLLLLTIAVY
jgi:hypothetical protein